MCLDEWMSAWVLWSTGGGRQGSRAPEGGLDIIILNDLLCRVGGVCEGGKKREQEHSHVYEREIKTRRRLGGGWRGYRRRAGVGPLNVDFPLSAVILYTRKHVR